MIKKKIMEEADLCFPQIWSSSISEHMVLITLLLQWHSKDRCEVEISIQKTLNRLQNSHLAVMKNLSAKLS